MTETRNVGIPKTMFVVGLIALILASSLIAVVAATYHVRMQAQTFQNGSRKSGLNYLSPSNRFYQNDSATEDNFELFKANNISSLSIRICWKSVYNDSNVLPNYKRLLAVADEYDLKVQFDFWTKFSDSWWMPDFLTSTYDIIRNSTVKQQWFAFVSDVMNQLKSYKSIESWTMMNEPYINETTDEELFYQCWSEQYELMRIIDQRPISIRFALGHSPWSGDINRTEAYQVCDYIAINEYLDPLDASYTRYGGNWAMFDTCLSDCENSQKPLVISEFGSDTGTDEDKREWYKQSLALFKGKGIQRAYAWAWQTIDPNQPKNEPFNIGPAQIGEQPKPAFFKLSFFVVISPDVSDDGIVNVLDLILIISHLGHANGDGHTPYSSDWYKCMYTDVQGDNAHNVLDLILCTSHLGEHW